MSEPQELWYLRFKAGRIWTWALGSLRSFLRAVALAVFVGLKYCHLPSLGLFSWPLPTRSARPMSWTRRTRPLVADVEEDARAKGWSARPGLRLWVIAAPDHTATGGEDVENLKPGGTSRLCGACQQGSFSGTGRLLVKQQDPQVSPWMSLVLFCLGDRQLRFVWTTVVDVFSESGGVLPGRGHARTDARKRMPFLWCETEGVREQGISATPCRSSRRSMTTVGRRHQDLAALAGAHEL